MIPSKRNVRNTQTERETEEARWLLGAESHRGIGDEGQGVCDSHGGSENVPGVVMLMVVEQLCA